MNNPSSRLKTVLPLVACMLIMVKPLLGQNAVSHVLDTFRTEERYLRGVQDTRYSSEALDCMDAFYGATTQALAQLRYDDLDMQERIDVLLLKNDVYESLRGLQEQRVELGRQKAYVPFAQATLALHADRRMGRYVDGEAAAEAIADIRKSVAAGRSAFEKYFAETAPDDVDAGSNTVATAVSNENSIVSNDLGVAASEHAEVEPLTAEAPKGSNITARLLALQVAQQVKHHQKLLGGWYGHYERFQPGFAWWVKTEWDKTREELTQYETHLRENLAEVKDHNEGPLLGEALGEARLAARIREEFLAYSAEELIELGERELAWCEAQMQKVAEELGVAAWTNALALIKDERAAPGRQSELVAQYAAEATAFVKDKSLLRVPKVCQDSWRISMVDENRQRTLPYALYSGQDVHVAYATRDMEHDTRQMSMRGNNPHGTRIVVAHEVIPGHHYQLYMSKQNRAYRGAFQSPFFVEGWALYWEMRLWDEGYARDAKDRAGMLFWRAHRCARIILTLKYHLGQLTPDEMVSFLVERIGHEKNQATAEVRRYISPNVPVLYQVSYMIGGLQFMSLWKEHVQSGDMTEIEFHDAVLALGPIPLDLIHSALKKADFPQDYVPRWRF